MTKAGRREKRNQEKEKYPLAGGTDDGRDRIGCTESGSGADGEGDRQRPLVQLCDDGDVRCAACVVVCSCDGSDYFSFFYCNAYNFIYCVSGWEKLLLDALRSVNFNGVTVPGQPLRHLLTIVLASFLPRRQHPIQESEVCRTCVVLPSIRQRQHVANSRTRLGSANIILRTIIDNMRRERGDVLGAIKLTERIMTQCVAGTSKCRVPT